MAFTGCGGTYEFGVGVGLQNIADDAGFILVSPQPLGNCWADGGFANSTGLTDVIFVSELLDTLLARYKVDSLRVYVCGLSSGAFLSFRLASHFSARISAIVSVAGTMPTKTAESNPPSNAVAVAILIGTGDALYGGSAPYRESVDSTVAKWRRYNGCSESSEIQNLPDLDPNDGCTVTKITYRDCSSGKEVVLYKINGGGHNWPGLVLPNSVRPQTMDIFASAEIFDFFRSPLSAVDEVAEARPSQFTLSQNYPNPFNPSTEIQFSLPRKSHVTLLIFDLLGREVATLVSEELSAGTYSTRWDASGMPSGVYIYRLSAGDFTQAKKLVLLR